MALTNTLILAHDHGTRRALQPRVAPTLYFTCQNRIFVLVVICDQTSAPVIGTRRGLIVHQRLLMYILISFLGASSICDQFSGDIALPGVQQHSQIRSAGGTYVNTDCTASAHGLLQRSLRSRFADHSLRLATLQHSKKLHRLICLTSE